MPDSATAMTNPLTTTSVSGLDRETKQKIKTWVLRLRHLLQDDFTTRLKRYGIESGKAIGNAPDYLSEDEKQDRRVIVVAIRRDAANERSGDDAIQAYVRECAFTLLNRLVGLKCMEAREILFVGGEATEAVTTRAQYGNRSRLLWQMRDQNKEFKSDEPLLWKEGLSAAFRAVTEDIALLFDPDSEWSRLWPTHKVLMDALGSINGLDAACSRGEDNSCFASPDFLGWVYQFFNVDEKEQIREATGGKPRTSHELAVINQFYTPDWIVKFLVDNTLGRVWLQMHPDTTLRSRINYLVPKTGEETTIPMKPARELKMLDPACGTMHMGQYAFGLLYEMYLEEMARAGEDGWPSEPSVSDLSAIPPAILANNLHGIDIDPRAIQIAALTLMLTMKEQAKAHGLDPQTVRVQRMNLVCANAVNLGETEMEEFLQSLDPAVFGGTEPLRRAVKAIWTGLQHVAELGSLIQVGEEVERTLSAPVSGRGQTIAHGNLSFDENWGKLQLSLTEEEKATAREHLENALTEYIRKNTASDDISRRLFAQETGKAIGLLDFLRQKYDAIVMNPPFGSPIAETKSILTTSYVNSSGNIYSYFIEAGLGRIARTGYIGSVSSNAYLTQASFSDFRQFLIEKLPPVAVLDCGWDILDGANVEVAAAVFGMPSNDVTTFLNLNPGRESKAIFEQWLNGKDKSVGFSHRIGSFVIMPDRAFLYDLPSSLQALYQAGKTLQPELATASKGMGSGTNERFYQRWWEVDKAEVGQGRKWVPLANGGEYSPFYRTYEHVVYWENDGHAIRHNFGSNGKPLFRFSGSRFMFKPGISWGKRTDFFNAQVLPKGSIFSDEGNSLFPHQENDCFLILGLLNSALICYLLNKTSGGHKTSGYVGKIPIKVGHRDILELNAKEYYELCEQWDTGNELSTNFVKPWLLQIADRLPEVTTITNLIDECMEWETQDSAKCRYQQRQIDAAVYSLYEISTEDRTIIERELSNRPNETVWPQMVGKSAEQKRLEHLCRLISCIVKNIVEVDSDGIVPLVTCASEPLLIDRVRKNLDNIFGVERSLGIESEINALLGKRTTIEIWLAKQYFKYHVGLYKKRPIFWHITSDDSSFGAIVHYHRFNRDRLQKLRSVYLYDFVQRVQGEVARLASATDSTARETVATLEGNLASARALDEKLRQIEEGEFAIKVPWKTPEQQPKGWNPDIDDGVKVNIGPFEAAGVLAVKKVV